MFRYAFPFEGNWNESLWILFSALLMFRYAFPFEGNWNPLPCRFLSLNLTVQIRFPVWRELKHYILPDFHPHLLPFTFRYAFPFEGNWNDETIWWNPSFFGSDTLSRLKGIETLWPFLSGIELKNFMFRYAFPFEGNWNKTPPFPSQLKFPRSDTLSRLKGIETRPMVRASPTPTKFRYAFPFEGNWNKWLSFFWSPFLKRVQIRFPVWRELKQGVIRPFNNPEP